jgi:hypothetical protein
MIKATIALLVVLAIAGSYVQGRTHAFSFGGAAPVSASSISSNPDEMSSTSGGTMARLELKNVQMIVVEMMGDNNLTELPQSLEQPTNDMGAFPDPFTLPSRKGLTPLDGYGYVLFGHDKTSDYGEEVLEYYANVRTTLWSYSADRDGTVHQHPGILAMP